MEELQARHRKEQRDLQSRVTQKKKQANKKTRKGVNDECDRLEAELKEKQQAEVAAINGDAVDGEILDEGMVKVSLEDNSEDSVAATSHEQSNDLHVDNGATIPSANGNIQTAPKKGNRQKARLARRAAEQDELVRQAEEDAKNLPDLKQQERERMIESMKKRSLQEKEIRADGHCLYSAVADQLEQLHIPLGSTRSDTPNISYKIVRATTADYIEQNPDDFEPFLDEPLAAYLLKIRSTAEWGGQLELMALAKSYATNIYVLQDFDRVEVIDSGAESDEKAMWLGYYKHGFGLGEHYNSLRKTP